VTRGGVDWEPNKSLGEKLTYLPNQTQRVSLLTRPRPHNYREVSDPRNSVRNKISVDAPISASKTEITDTMATKICCSGK
jgi:hypothetical protein